MKVNENNSNKLTRREKNQAKENSLSKLNEKLIYQDDDYSTKQGGVLNSTLTATTNYTTRNMHNSNITTTNHNNTNNNLNNTQLYESNFDLNSCVGTGTDFDRSYQQVSLTNAIAKNNTAKKQSFIKSRI